MITICELLKIAKSKAKHCDIFLEIEILLAFVLDKDRAFLVAHPEMEVSNRQEKHFFRLFSRLMQGESVAYITQKKEFYGLDFFVNKHVLIPRPETEFLVEKAFVFIEQNFYTNKSEKIKILDVGTGSGCIAVSMSKQLPGVSVLGVDISEKALLVAQKNAKNHNVEELVHFRKNDLLENIDEHFDLIVANLPYIGKKRFNFVSRDVVAYEPGVALFGGKNGLMLYGKLFQQLSAASWRPFALFGEFGFLQMEELELLLKKYFPDAKKITFFQDYADIDRVFMVEFEKSGS